MASGAIRALLWGCAVQFVGIVALGSLAGFLPQPSTALLAAALAVFGAGQGLVMAPLAGVVLATVRPSHAGSSAGLLATVQQASRLRQRWRCGMSSGARRRGPTSPCCAC